MTIGILLIGPGPSPPGRRRTITALVAVMGLLVTVLVGAFTIGRAERSQPPVIALPEASATLPTGAAPAVDEPSEEPVVRATLEALLPGGASVADWLPASGVLVVLAVSDAVGFRLRRQPGASLKADGTPRLVRLGAQENYVALEAPSVLREAGRAHAAELYLIPAGERILTLACVAATQSAAAVISLCESVAGTLKLVQRLAAAVPSRSQLQADEARQARELAGLVREREDNRGALAQARTPGVAAKVAAALASVSARAAVRIRRTWRGAFEWWIAQRFAETLDHQAGGYSGLAAALRGTSRKRLRAAEQRLGEDDATFAAALGTASVPLPRALAVAFGLT